MYFQAIFDSARTRKDGTVAVQFATQELTPDKMANLFSQLNQFCIVAVKPENFTKEEENNISDTKTEPAGKTHSQKQRNILYRIWEHRNEGYTEFTDYYAYRMERNLDRLRNELDELTLGI